MKNISLELKNHLSGELTMLATCWKITRRDSVVMGFTSHDKSLSFDGVDYVANSGFTPSDIKNSDSLEGDLFNLEGFLDSSFITESDLLAGKYDFAEIEIFQVNYADLTQGKIIHRTGWFGEISFDNGRFNAEISGLTSKLAKTIGDLYSPTCRAVLGDSRCSVSMAGYVVTGSVTGLTDNRVFADSSRVEDNGYFNYGKITFTSGNNDGLSMEVKAYADGEIELVLPMSYAILIGDTYSLEVGCDKIISTCVAKFNNAVNFRGEPFVPGMDEILKTSSTK